LYGFSTVRLQYQQTKQKGSIVKISQKTRRILASLKKYRNQVFTRSDGTLTIGGQSTTDPSQPTITHADFVAQVVLPALHLACKRFGQEQVARDLVTIAMPLYQIEGHGSYKYDCPAIFWDDTVAGGIANPEIPKNRTNRALAARYGIKYVFGPIARLGKTHQKTRVFCASKFFYAHACRMGEIIATLPHFDYLRYTQLCELLLENGIYDWSIEFNAKQWKLLRPLIKDRGLDAVLMPMINAMVSIKDLPGTLERKYRFSLLCWTITDILPWLVASTRKQGGPATEDLLAPIVKLITCMSLHGAFQVSDMKTEQFFRSFKRYPAQIARYGVQETLRRKHRYWKKVLCPVAQ
jgi:hypothetical protein